MPMCETCGRTDSDCRIVRNMVGRYYCIDCFHDLGGKTTEERRAGPALSKGSSTSTKVVPVFNHEKTISEGVDFFKSQIVKLEEEYSQKLSAFKTLASEGEGCQSFIMLRTRTIENLKESLKDEVDNFSIQLYGELLKEFLKILDN